MGLVVSEYTHITAVPNIGQNAEKLKEYNLDHKRVIAAAERTQRRAKAYLPRGIEGVVELLTEIGTNPGSNPRDEAIYMNVPVCDLDRVEEWDWKGCRSTGQYHGNTVKDCVMRLFSHHCKHLTEGEGDKKSEFPYQWDDKFPV